MKNPLRKWDGELVAKRLFITVGLAVAISLLVSGVKGGELKIICGWFVSFWNWATDFAVNMPVTVIISSVLFGATVLGAAIYKYKKKKPMMFILSGILFFLSLFPLFYHMGALGDFITALIWCLIAVSMNILDEFPSDDWKFYVGTICFLLVLAYYADFFIFGWDKPYLTLIVAAIIIIVTLYVKIRDYRDQKKEDAYLLQKKQVREEYAKAVKEEMEKLPIVDVFLEYIKAAKIDGNRSDEILKFIENTPSVQYAFTEETTETILQEIIHSSVKLDEEFLKTFENTLGEDDVQSILMAVPNWCSDSLPILFQVSKRKPEIIQAYLKDPMNHDFFFEAKRTFNTKSFYVLVNALVFSYNKEWKESDFIFAVRYRIQELVNYAAEYLPQIHDKETANKLANFLKKLQNDNSGLLLHWPKIS
ncbi:MAG: hypothetical protein WCT50_04495 [Patescibacteria group bacterium]